MKKNAPMLVRIGTYPPNEAFVCSRCGARPAVALKGVGFNFPDDGPPYSWGDFYTKSLPMMAEVGFLEAHELLLKMFRWFVAEEKPPPHDLLGYIAMQLEQPFRPLTKSKQLAMEKQLAIALCVGYLSIEKEESRGEAIYHAAEMFDCVERTIERALQRFAPYFEYGWPDENDLTSPST